MSDEVRGGPKPPPRFLPNLIFRVTCERSKQVHEFKIPISVTGVSPTVKEDINQKLIAVLIRLGLLSKDNPEISQGVLNACEEKDREEGQS